MPNTYTPQSEIARRQALMEAMAGRNTTGQGIGGGLANMLRSYRGGKENAAIGQAQTTNDQIASDETQALINSMRQGGLQGPPTAGGQQPNLQFQTPGLQNLQLQQAMKAKEAEDAQARALELQGLRNQGVRGSAGGRSFAGQPVLDGGGKQIGMNVQQADGSVKFIPNLEGMPEGTSVHRYAGQLQGDAGFRGNVTEANVSDATAVGNAETGVAVDKDSKLAAQGLQQDIAREQSDLPSLEANNAAASAAAVEEAVTRVERLFEGRDAKGRLDVSLANTDDTIAALDRLLDSPGLEIATGLSGYFDPRNLPSFSGSDAKILIRQLGNRNFVEALAAMRENSKTGGAVGNVSDAEGDKLKNVIAALGDTNLSDDEMVNQMKIARQILERYKTNLKSAYEIQFGGNSSGRPPLSSFNRQN